MNKVFYHWRGQSRSKSTNNENSLLRVICYTLNKLTLTMANISRRYHVIDNYLLVGTFKVNPVNCCRQSTALTICIVILVIRKFGMFELFFNPVDFVFHWVVGYVFRYSTELNGYLCEVFRANWSPVNVMTLTI